MHEEKVINLWDIPSSPVLNYLPIYRMSWRLDLSVRSILIGVDWGQKSSDLDSFADFVSRMCVCVYERERKRAMT